MGAPWLHPIYEHKFVSMPNAGVLVGPRKRPTPGVPLARCGCWWCAVGCEGTEHVPRGSRVWMNGRKRTSDNTGEVAGYPASRQALSLDRHCLHSTTCKGF